MLFGRSRDSRFELLQIIVSELRQAGIQETLRDVRQIRTELCVIDLDGEIVFYGAGFDGLFEADFHAGLLCQSYPFAFGRWGREAARLVIYRRPLMTALTQSP